MKPMSQEEVKELKERCDKISIAWINTQQVKRLIYTLEEQKKENAKLKMIINKVEEEYKVLEDTSWYEDYAKALEALNE